MRDSIKSNMSALSDREIEDKCASTTIDTYAELKGLQSTNVDMMFEGLANPLKLNPEIQHFRKEDYENISSKSTKSNKSNKSSKSSRSAKSTVMGNNKTEYNFRDEMKSDFFKNTEQNRDKYKEKREQQKKDDKREEWLAKFKMMQNLFMLKKRGITLTKNYNMNDSLEDMEAEYNFHKGIADKTNGVKLMTNFMLNTCWLIEMGNQHYDPFGMNLEGWSDQLANDTDEFYDVFSEMYEKYTSNGRKIPPEIKLVFLLAFSAGKYGMANKFLSPKPLEEELDDEKRAELRENILRDRLAKEKEALNKKNEAAFKEFAQTKAEYETLEKKYDEFNDEKYYENKLNYRNELLKQKEMQRQELLDALVAQNSDAASDLNIEPDRQYRPPPIVSINSKDLPQVVEKSMPKPNFEHIHRRRQADLLALKNRPKEQAPTNPIIISTPPIKIKTPSVKQDDLSRDEEIRYNPNIQDIIIKTSNEQNSSYSSGSSKRAMRQAAIIIS